MTFQSFNKEVDGFERLVSYKPRFRVTSFAKVKITYDKLFFINQRGRYIWDDFGCDIISLEAVYSCHERHKACDAGMYKRIF